MILAGIDEAGYGPLLGPLVVGCCAFELPDADPLAPLPCLWKRLGKLLSRHRSKSGRKLHVNDSKQVYSPSSGLRELERSLLVLCHASDRPPGDFAKLLEHVCPAVLTEMGGYPWYRGAESKFPLENDAIALRLFANALRLEMLRTQTACVHLAAEVVLERRLNRMIEATRNKAGALFSISAIHLDYLLRNHAHQGLVILCDRQGGRGHYGSLLRTMFEDWALEITSEQQTRAEYRLSRDNHTVRIIFTEKAEEQAMSVAIASMLCKYLREVLMHRFNAFWQSHLPEVAPTAGYYTDGERFLRDIAPTRAAMGIADADLIRCR